jgi:hypothetical protein
MYERMRTGLVTLEVAAPGYNILIFSKILIEVPEHADNTPHVVQKLILKNFQAGF